MQPVRVSIAGHYWDSHVYAGRLHLFGLDGSLTIVDWDRLISEAELPVEVGFALEVAFRRGDYFYGPQWSLLFEDEEFRLLLLRRFELLAGHELRFDRKAIKPYILWQVESPFPFPHADATVYGHHFFGVGRTGLWQSFKPGKKYPYGEAEQVWDCPSHAVDGNYGAIAVAAGDEGLFELSVDFDSDGLHGDVIEPRLVSASKCTHLSWTYGDLYGGASDSPGFFVKVLRRQWDDERTKWPIPPAKASAQYEWGDRMLSESVEVAYELSEAAIFGRSESTFSWAARDKLCQLAGRTVRLVRYNPWARSKNPFEIAGDYVTKTGDDTIVSAQVAPFGIVIEHEKGLEILLSDGEVKGIRGEPVRWRVFPRSKFYENQLHVIRPDRLDVFSFNHDYFINQKSKLFGSRVLTSRAVAPVLRAGR